VIAMLAIGTLMSLMITAMIILGASISLLAIVMSWLYPCTQAADRRPTP
jgi:hypothetical protein